MAKRARRQSSSDDKEARQISVQARSAIVVALVTVLGAIVVALIQRDWSSEDSSSVAALATPTPIQSSESASPSGGAAHPIRRQGPLTLKAWWGYDLDAEATTASDWKGTRESWKEGQDVGYQSGPDVKKIVARMDQARLAPLKVAPSYSYEDCATAPYGAPLVTEPWVARDHATCVITSEGRYALLVINGLDETHIAATVTVWE